MTRPIFHLPASSLSALLALVFAGCEKPEIRVYTVDKEKPAATPAPTAKASEEAPARPRPQVSYTLPTGWKEAGANSLSLVNFSIKTGAGEATVNITPLAGMNGREAAIVNMWRAQVGQPALNDQEVAAGFTSVETAGGKGQLFEVTGTREKQPLRIITVMVPRGNESWFYKLQGDEAIVAEQKPAFLEFLKTVKITDGPATAQSSVAPAAEPAAPAVVAPEGWQAVSPGQMQVAKFTVAKEGGKAEVSVSVFPSDTGGTLANVNRWRRQLGLADVDEAGLQELVTPLEGASIAGAPGAILADLTNENRRMLGAIVPREGRWWFYKMMGDAAVVNAERESFVHFVKNQP